MSILNLHSKLRKLIMRCVRSAGFGKPFTKHIDDILKVIEKIILSEAKFLKSIAI
jgi:hypothetical protein